MPDGQPRGLARHRLRRRLQPRAVAGGGLARGRRADAARPASTWSASASSPGRCSSPHPGEYEFGWLDRCSTCCTRTGSASTSARPTAAPPAWFYRAAPGGPAGRPRRACARLRRARHDLPAARRRTATRPPRHHRAARRALRRPPGASSCGTCTTSTASPSRDCYCDACVGAAFRALAARAVRRRSRRSTRPGARRSGASATATGTRSTPPRARRDRGQPGPAAGLRALQLRRAPARCFRRERDILRRARARHPGHHQLHGHQLQVDSTTGPGRGEVDVVSNDHYLAGRARRRTTSTWRWPPTSPGRWPAAGRGCSWSTPPARSTGSRATSPSGPGEMARNSPRPRGPRRRRGACSSSGGASRRGAEKFHSAMVPHGGTDTRDLARGRRARRGARRAGARCAAPDGARRRRRAVGLGVLVGAGAGRGGPATDLRLPGAGRRATTSGSGATPHRRLRPPGGGPVRVPAGRRARSSTCWARRRRSNLERVRRPRAARWWCRTSPAIVDEHDAVHPRGYPGAAGRRARPRRRGVRCRCARTSACRVPDAGAGRPSPRTSGPSTCAPARRRGAGVVRRTGRPPAGRRSPGTGSAIRDGVVRRDPARTRPAWATCSARRLRRRRPRAGPGLAARRSTSSSASAPAASATCSLVNHTGADAVVADGRRRAAVRRPGRGRPAARPGRRRARRPE